MYKSVYLFFFSGRKFEVLNLNCLFCKFVVGAFWFIYNNLLIDPMGVYKQLFIVS